MKALFLLRLRLDRVAVVLVLGTILVLRSAPLHPIIQLRIGDVTSRANLAVTFINSLWRGDGGKGASLLAFYAGRISSTILLVGLLCHTFYYTLLPDASREILLLMS